MSEASNYKSFTTPLEKKIKLPNMGDLIWNLWQTIKVFVGVENFLKISTLIINYPLPNDKEHEKSKHH
jgi:hypothetical protein